jgi:hypothetical protein
VSLPGVILCHQGAVFVQPFAIDADLTGRTLTFTVWDGADPVLVKTVGGGITVTDAVLGDLEVGFQTPDTLALAPKHYYYTLAYSDAPDVLSEGRFTVLAPPVA